jgi:hypothetical protein
MGIHMNIKKRLGGVVSRAAGFLLEKMEATKYDVAKKAILAGVGRLGGTVEVAEPNQHPRLKWILPSGARVEATEVGHAGNKEVFVNCFNKEGDKVMESTSIAGGLFVMGSKTGLAENFKRWGDVLGKFANGGFEKTPEEPAI